MNTPITIVTTTRNRYLAFSLLLKWMKHQQGDFDIQHVVVNDGASAYNYVAYGEARGTPLYEQKLDKGNSVWYVGTGENTWQTSSIQQFMRKPHQFEKKPSLVKNWQLALEHIRNEIVVVMEDDDFYSPDYIDCILTELETADLVGISNCVYWNIQKKTYLRKHNFTWSTLGASAFRMSTVGEFMKQTCSTIKDVFIDKTLWNDFAGRRTLIDNLQGRKEVLHCGIKGLPGPANLGTGFEEKGVPDPNYKQLKAWIGLQNGLTYQRLFQ